ncbi:MAG: alginate export family protein [Nitrospirota bacterium]
MKKYLALILGVLFVLSFAASAFAIHAEIPSETQAVVAKGTTQITLGGEIRVRGWWKDNLAAANDLTIHLYPYNGVSYFYDPDLEFYWSSRYMPWNTDISSSHYDIAYGGPTPGATLFGGATATYDAHKHSYYDQRVRLSIDAQISPNVQGYVQLESNSGTTDTWTWGSSDFNKKPTDLHILQAWILYKGSGLFGFPAGLKIGHMPLALSEKQFFDHTKFGDDAVVFFMDPTKDLHIGLLTIKAVEGSTRDNTDDADVYVALTTYKLANVGTLGANYTYVNWPDAALSFQNLGLHSNGKVAGLTYKAELDIQFGKIFDGTTSEAKFRGLGFMAGLGYEINPVNIRAAFGYGTGDDDPFDNKVKEFQTVLGNDIHYSFVYEYMVSSSAFNQIISQASGSGISTDGRATGLANTTYYNLGVDYSPMKDLKLSLDGFILRASKIPDGLDMSKTIGWEVDARASYQIAKNLNYSIIAGYFQPGKFYDPGSWISPEEADSLSVDKKGVPAFMHALTLSF